MNIKKISTIVSCVAFFFVFLGESVFAKENLNNENIPHVEYTLEITDNDTGEKKALAVEDEDVKYVGTIDSFSGRFTPSFAGPNPKRKFSTNNAGNIKVVATYKDGVETYKADSHMMVTVQKWVNPPIN